MLSGTHIHQNEHARFHSLKIKSQYENLNKINVLQAWRKGNGSNKSSMLNNKLLYVVMLGTAYQLVTIKSRNRKRINECLKIIYLERNVLIDKVFKLDDPVNDVLEVLKLASANLSPSLELEVLDIVERTASDYKMRETLEKIWSRRQSIEKHI